MVRLQRVFMYRSMNHDDIAIDWSMHDSNLVIEDSRRHLRGEVRKDGEIGIATESNVGQCDRFSHCLTRNVHLVSEIRLQ